MAPVPHPSRDRHGRGARADNDLRRRPSDGFRTASRARFTVLAQRAIATLPHDLRRHLAGASLTVEDVPGDGDGPLARIPGDVPLCVVTLRPPEPPSIRLFRRPLELRATTRAQLEDEIAGAVGDAVRDARGLGPDAP